MEFTGCVKQNFLVYFLEIVQCTSNKSILSRFYVEKQLFPFLNLKKRKTKLKQKTILAFNTIIYWRIS